MRVVLWDLQSPINVGMILRTAEVYHFEVTAYDRHGVFGDAAARRTISDFACGALQRQPPLILAEASALVRHGRSIATAITPDAQPLQSFAFQDDDCIYVGNEYDGLPEDILWGSDARVTIPMPPGFLPKPASASPIDPSRRAEVVSNGTPNLNVAVATSIILFEAYAQTAREPLSGSAPSQRAAGR